jgi:quercetin dioxygenase-like cupin family protein
MRFRETVLLSFLFVASFNTLAAEPDAARPSASGSALSTPPSGMVIRHNGSQPSALVSAPNFTRTVRVDPLFPNTDLPNASASLVTFEPGAHSVWHTHPAGQMLMVTAGAGWIQQAGQSKQVIKPGDVIWTPPGVKHWHGGTASTGMSHIAIQSAVNGQNVEWLEPVSDEQYRN